MDRPIRATQLPGRPGCGRAPGARALVRRLAPALLFALGLAAAPGVDAGQTADGASGTDAVHPCETGATLATGRPDPALISPEASRGVQAFWCETYDRDGTARRAGPYWDLHPDGSIRVRTQYVDSRIEGPIEVFDEAGGLWLRGELEAGVWTGALELFHPSGGRWLSAHFQSGELHGAVETWFVDGSLESETRFQARREDGIASSYFPAAAGGGLRSRVRVESDQIVDRGPAGAPAVSAAAEDLAGPRPLARRDSKRGPRDDESSLR